MYLDILWVAETGAEAVIRVHEACVQNRCCVAAFVMSP